MKVGTMLTGERIRIIGAAVIGISLLLVACGDPQPSPSAMASGTAVTSPAASASVAGVASGSERVTHPDISVIVGTDEQHMVITEPLVEVVPGAGGGDAALVVRFASPADTPILLGIEGAIGFLAAYAPDGSVVMQRMVPLDRETEIGLPRGDYRFVASYRTCDGSCALLDPEQQLCVVDGIVETNLQYALDVEILPQRTGRCSLTEA